MNYISKANDKKKATLKAQEVKGFLLKHAKSNRYFVTDSEFVCNKHQTLGWELIANYND